MSKARRSCHSLYFFSLNKTNKKTFSIFKVRLDGIQFQELEALRKQLKEEEDVLNTYQSRQAAHLASHVEKELNELKDRVDLRKELLENRVRLLFL